MAAAEAAELVLLHLAMQQGRRQKEQDTAATVVQLWETLEV